MAGRSVEWVKSHWPMLFLYAFLVTMAVGAVVIWSHPDWVGGNWATHWMPHIGTSAVTILVTIAVVDQIVRRQHSLPLRPRRERARRRIGNAWLQYVRGLAVDYEETHVGGNFRPIPADTLQVIDHWLNAGAEDRVRDDVLAGGDPFPLTGAENLAGELNGLLDSVNDPAALDDELKNAISTFLDEVRLARLRHLSMKDLGVAEWNSADAVRAARSLGEVIRSYGYKSHGGLDFPRVSATDGLRMGWRSLDPLTVARITSAHRKRAVLTALKDVYDASLRAPAELDAAWTEFWRILEEGPQNGWAHRDDRDRMIFEALERWKALGGSPEDFPIPKHVLDEWRGADRESRTEPSRSSWLNLIERWFAEVTNKAIRRT